MSDITDLAKELEERNKLQQQIDAVKTELRNLLKEKYRLLKAGQEAIGCTCGVIIEPTDAVRLLNRYCPIHGDNKL